MVHAVIYRHNDGGALMTFCYTCSGHISNVKLSNLYLIKPPRPTQPGHPPWVGVMSKVMMVTTIAREETVSSV